MKLSYLLLWLLVSLWIVPGVFAQGAGTPPDITELSRRIDREGSAPVILRLRGDPIEDLAPAVVQAQQSALRRRQDGVLTDIGLNRSRPGVKVFDYLPLLAANLDQAAFRAAVAHPDVLSIYPDELALPTLAGSVPLIGANTAWGQGFSGSGQVVAVLDTGVDSEHPFITTKVVAEGCFSTTIQSQSSSVCPNGLNQQTGAGAGVDCPAEVVGCNHGTHVAGIVAGEGGSFSGVARGANLLAVQVFSRFPASYCSQFGYSSDCVLSYTSDQIRGLEYVYSLRTSLAIASVNMSLGGGRYTAPCDTAAQKSIIDMLRSVGIATVIASGNSGFVDAMGAPACISSAISVGSTTKSDGISSFSNHVAFLDVLAPGSSIQSSIPGGGFASFNGTSMATPHVAGALAVIRSASPSASVDDMLNALQDTGIEVVDNQRSGSLGIAKPRIQVDAAIAALSSSAGRLSVNPTTGFSASGPAGGPFTPDSQSYVLSNSGDSPLNWQLSDDVSWASANPGSGSLAPGAEVTVSLALEMTSALTPGDYAGTLSFTNTSTGSGNALRSLNLRVTPPPAANDKFQDGILLQGSSGSVSGGNIGATRESGEPLHGGQIGSTSVWWRWVAPGAGSLVVDTLGSGFDTLLGAYTGTAVHSLGSIAANDDAADISPLSRIEFSATAGTTYHLAVDGRDMASGAIQLNWQFTPQVAPGELSVTPGTGFSTTGLQGGPFIASADYALTNVGGSDINWSAQSSVDWVSISPSTGQLAPGADTTVTLSLNDQADSLAVGTYNGEVSFNGQSRPVALRVIGVGGNSNDDFANALLLVGTSAAVSGENSQASQESGEPDHADSPAERSLWWSWIATQDGPVVVDTFGSNFDTTLGVYQGNSVDALTEVKANDDSGDGLQSRVLFTASFGSEYHIAVDGYEGNLGSIQLNLEAGFEPPVNDDFVDALLLEGPQGSTSIVSHGASQEIDEPDFLATDGGASVWWQWTPNFSGWVNIDTLGSDFDTLLVVYSGNTLLSLSEVAANDDIVLENGYYALQSAVRFQVSEGISYHIAVDGYDAESGSIQLNYTAIEIFLDGFE